jgi:hypothetical protein
MFKKTLLILVSLVLIAISAFAQQAAATKPLTADAPATKAQILKFMDLMHVKPQIGQMFDGMRAQARLGAEQGFKQKVPNATPSQLEKVDAISDEAFNGFPIEELLEAMVPIYQRHLSKADLNSIITFYSSPVGQRLVKELPAMMTEGMQAGGEIGRTRMAEANRKIEEKIDALANEVGQDNSAPKSK